MHRSHTYRVMEPQRRVTAVVSCGRRFSIPILGFESQTETEEEQPSSDMAARKTVSVEKRVFVKLKKTVLPFLSHYHKKIV